MLKVDYQFSEKCVKESIILSAIAKNNLPNGLYSLEPHWVTGFFVQLFFFIETASLNGTPLLFSMKIKVYFLR
jgi:hypothetical protein